MIRFEWDEKNAEEHWCKHHISFEDAKLVFSDPHSITRQDNRFDRFRLIWPEGQFELLRKGTLVIKPPINSIHPVQEKLRGEIISIHPVHGKLRGESITASAISHTANP